VASTIARAQRTNVFVVLAAMSPAISSSTSLALFNFNLFQNACQPTQIGATVRGTLFVPAAHLSVSTEVDGLFCSVNEGRLAK